MMSRVLCAVATIQCCVAFSPPQQRTTTSPTFHGSAAFPIRKCAKNNIPIGGGSVDNDNGHPSISVRMRSRKFSSSSLYDGAEYANAECDDQARVSDKLRLRVATDDSGGGGVGGYNPGGNLGLQRPAPNVGDPQLVQLEPMNIAQVMTELQAIQSQGPKKYCILGTRHCSFLHQQIVEML